MACYPFFKAIITGNDDSKFEEFRKYAKIFPSLSRLDIKYSDKLDNEVVINGETKWSLWFDSDIYMSFSKMFDLDMKIYTDNIELYYREFLHINCGKVLNFDRKIYDNEADYFEEEPEFNFDESPKEELIKKGQKLLDDDLTILGIKGQEGGIAIYYFTMMLTTTRNFLNCPRPQIKVNDSFITKVIDQDKFKRGINWILDGDRDWDNYLEDEIPKVDSTNIEINITDDYLPF